MRAYSQFPPPDFHRLDTRPYGLRTKTPIGREKGHHNLHSKNWSRDKIETKGESRLRCGGPIIF